jgi:hypothetical protein
MKYRIKKYFGGGFYIMTNDGGGWEEVTKYCGGPAGTCAEVFDTIEEAKKWIKEDIKGNKDGIVFEFDSEKDVL